MGEGLGGGGKAAVYQKRRASDPSELNLSTNKKCKLKSRGLACNGPRLLSGVHPLVQTD